MSQDLQPMDWPEKDVLATIRNNSRDHPPCASTITRPPLDITHLLAGDGRSFAISPLDCVLNPSIVHLGDGRYLLSAWAVPRHDVEINGNWSYTLKLLPYMERTRRCNAIMPSGAGPWFNFFPDVVRPVLAVLRIDPESGAVETLAHKVEQHFHAVDVRLFRGDDGTVRLLHFLQPDGDKNSKIQVETLRVREQPPAAAGGRPTYSIDVLPDTLSLKFAGQGKEEKNWVPWHGVAKMSYPKYPVANSHMVLDFGSYRNPVAVGKSPTHETPAPVIQAITDYYRSANMRYAGGTPAVEFVGPSGEREYLTVGHVVITAHCIHGRSPGAPAGAAELGQPYCAPEHQKEKPWFFRDVPLIPWGNHWTALSSRVKFHHARDYMLYFQTFSADPPHALTRLSDAIIPMHDPDTHGGIFFPLGLEKLHGSADRYVLTYGRNDDSSHMLILTVAEIASFLKPIGEVKPETLAFCSMYKQQQ